MGGSPKLDLSQNQILAALPAKESARLRPHLQLVSHSLREVLFREREPVRYIYFPQSAVVSLLAGMEDGKNFEVCLVGREGLVGLWALLGAKRCWYNAVVQIPGDSLRIKADVLRAEFKREGALQDQLHRYTRYVLAQVSQTAACNRAHRLEQRLARLLLMTRDRVRANEFPATHEFLSHMLGASRSEVTVAAGILRKSGVISYFRGRVMIVDRKGLESAACECYQIIHAELTNPR